MGERGGRGAIPFPDFDRSVNPPISIRGGGKIMPTTILLAPMIFRPSYDPGLKDRKKREKSQTFLFTCAGLILLSKVP